MTIWRLACVGEVVILDLEKKIFKFSKKKKQIWSHQICCVEITLLRGVSQKNGVNQSVSADKCCGEPVM